MYDLINLDQTKTKMKFLSYMLLKDFKLFVIVIILNNGFLHE